MNKLILLCFGFCLVGVCYGSDGSHFCYDSSDPKCPGPEKWSGKCNTNSKSQSPIRIPKSATSSRESKKVDFRKSSYHSKSFTISNSGHGVTVKLNKDPKAGSQTPHLGFREGSDYTEYRLDSLHFHWGKTDSVGSEHCLEKRCYSMEVHLVHFKKNFQSVEEALSSSDPSALAVIGVFLDASESGATSGLAPVFKNVDQVKDSTDGHAKKISESLDLGPIFNALNGDSKVYTYQGSLTTPGCDEKVRWFVIEKAFSILDKDLKKFRSVSKKKGVALTENHRPLQDLNKREVYLAQVVKAKD